VIKPFLQFFISFNYHQVHNMLTLKLNPHFKSLWVVRNYVGHKNAICLIAKYDVKENIPLLMINFLTIKH
jgi:hypothetical protein